MEIEPGQRVCLDTNILIEATDKGRALHAKAVQALEELPRAGVKLLLATQVVREYLVVATRPVTGNGLGMSIEDAANNIREFRKGTHLISETSTASDRLIEWSLTCRKTGNQLHDLQILATAAEADAQFLLTCNPTDFPSVANLLILPLKDLLLPLL